MITIGKYFYASEIKIQSLKRIGKIFVRKDFSF